LIITIIIYNYLITKQN